MMNTWSNIQNNKIETRQSKTRKSYLFLRSSHFESDLCHIGTYLAVLYGEHIGQVSEQYNKIVFTRECAHTERRPGAKKIYHVLSTDC